MCIDGSYCVKTGYKILCQENVHAGNANPNSGLPKSFWSRIPLAINANGNLRQFSMLLWGCDELLGVRQKHFSGLHSVGSAPTSIPELIDLVQDKQFDIAVFAMTCWADWNHRNKVKSWGKSAATG